MHNAALRALGLDALYVAFDVRPERLPDAIQGLEALGVEGANCTIPHKEALLLLMDELTDEAVLIGAANTIVFREGRRIGINTDAPGFLGSLRSEGIDPAGLPAVVLGAGGSARAVVAALARSGARVLVANRTPGRARSLAQEMNAKIDGGAVTASGMDAGALAEAIQQAELLVNTTSAGMTPQMEEMPPIPVEAIHSGLFVYDLIYNPRETLLLRAARARGARGVNGAGMLAHQGALALEEWTGLPAPVELMERVIAESLADE